MGQNDCPIIVDWQAMKHEFLMAVQKVDAVAHKVGETDEHVLQILEHVRHLEKLDVIAVILEKVARNLLYAVVGAMLIFGSLLTVYVVKDTTAIFQATGPSGVGLRVEGGHPK